MWRIFTVRPRVLRIVGPGKLPLYVQSAVVGPGRIVARQQLPGGVGAADPGGEGDHDAGGGAESGGAQQGAAAEGAHRRRLHAVMVKAVSSMITATPSGMWAARFSA
ncbi:hypothetical protein Ato02nite_037300 [Paractinoplanes toevensis]|uniref:Uncharacterized protein n=1 Tax=Paractinoplanes toevensis TaxID=571911 RepID=A0A919W118_9ACTN|nr:hypothetical protein Ato02nite_037300 [Actinoplanes toevensis]